MNFSEIKNIHFIGVGGIGVSALARLMMELGKSVSGSDLSNSIITDQLKDIGVNVIIGPHKDSNIQINTQLVVYTNAIVKTNPELKKAQKIKAILMSYPELLARLMETHLSIIVSGTHGKSTTTAMLAKIFIEAGLDPSVVVGTNVNDFNGNARLGLGRHFIAEGDEFHEAFLNYNPISLILNNIESDHLDYYKTEENIIKAFTKVVKKVPKGGVIVANAEDKNIKKVLKSAKAKVLTFGINDGDYQVTHIVRHGELVRFAVKGLERFDLAIRMPGIHNVSNALAAAVLALSFGIEIDIIKKALLNFSGIWRRFEIKGKNKGVTIVDDYAHHPTEIRATLKAAKSFFKGKRIWCVFQPHSGNRTNALFSDFTKSFTDCDQLILTDIYKVAGREKKDHVDMKKFVQDIINVKQKKTVIYIKNYKSINTYLRKKIKSGDVVITMGAGTITEVSDKLLT
ncbi:MAG: UDP-N-acetylmuramate--L-alanine ligase [Candidatus Kerfeldbacteria bacterium]